MVTLETINDHFAEVQNTLTHIDDKPVFAIVEKLKIIRENNKIVFIIGNGGSAATASHFANDLIKMCGIQAISIPDMVPTITAYGNDIRWAEMFSEPFRVMAKDGDMLFAISCSGASPNIVGALGHVKATWPGRKRILLTGREKSISSDLSQYTVFVPHEDIRVQEDIHMIVCHAIVGALKENKK